MFDKIKAFVARVKSKVSAVAEDPRTASAFKGFVVGFIVAGFIAARVACEAAKVKG